MSSPSSALSPVEIAVGCAAAAAIQVAFFGLLVLAGAANAHIQPAEEKRLEAEPIAVKPVVDDLPLLKLGSKQDQKPKLPDMWRKQAPTPVKRYEESSAPSTKAEDTPEAVPTSKLADKDKEAPPPDAEVIKELDHELEDSPTQEEAPQMQEEGHQDGSPDGTETDPLKANAANLYRAKISAWFNARFRPPVGQIPCEELKKLSASVTVRVGPDRTVASYAVTRPSGNPIFDEKVRSTLDTLIGQELPPPPPLYPDILESSVFPQLSGAGARCDD